MRMLALVFTLLAWVASGHRARLQSEQVQAPSAGTQNPLEALARCLLVLSPAAGWNGVGASGLSRQFSVSSSNRPKQELKVPSSLMAAAAKEFAIRANTAALAMSTAVETGTADDVGTFAETTDEITEENPLRVIIAGAGVGGLALANSLVKDPKIQVQVLERTDQFKRFGGPIQLASNALQVLKEMDAPVYDSIMEKFTLTGDKENGIKDGIRDEWYAKFDLASPAESRNLPLTGVIERPDLQEIYLNAIPKGVIKNGDGVAHYHTNPKGHGVKAVMQSGKVIEGDVIIGADGIWSAVRASMRDEPAKGEGSGCTYSGYTVFAGELDYDSFDNGEVGYKVYIGPQQYFVITDIGNGRYQWYAFLGREPGSAESEPKPLGQVPFLKTIFNGWSKDIHHILDATKENEIAQRDLYDRPPSVLKPWNAGPVALLGDAIHAMMPNLGQGGGQAIEDAFVLEQELKSAKSRNEISSKLDTYRSRRLIRSAAVQGLSRIASDVIVKGFDTPAKIVLDGGLKFENFNYAGIVTKLLQPILPIFFTVQFNFLYDGWRNDFPIDFRAALGFLIIGGAILVVGSGALEGFELGALGLDAILESEAIQGSIAGVQEFFEGLL
mmetsp:Transcript_17260/g.31830  ORF Transcript_17260/g.31830 Transcript_17260/m.31830 type:complete len:612 (+) Transcript_17260:54-1889(+)